MRQSVLLRSFVLLAFVAVLTACGSAATPLQPAGHSAVVNHYDNPQDPNK
jgi:predicted small lipoprotein YifL